MAELHKLFSSRSAIWSSKDTTIVDGNTPIPTSRLLTVLFANAIRFITRYLHTLQRSANLNSIPSIIAKRASAATKGASISSVCEVV
jgi:hypothetical protein